MRLQRTSMITALLLPLALAACGQDEECVYTRPVAVITSDAEEVRTNQDVVLSADESVVACNREHTYSWTFQSVPDGSAVNDARWQANNTQNAATQTINPDEPGTYVIKLSIFDGIQNSVEVVYVLEVDADNLPPVAEAGPDQATTVDQLAQFDGSESYDPDPSEQGGIEFRWVLEEAPIDSTRDSGDVYGADEEVASFVPDVPGTYVFSLQVRDEFVWSNKDFASLVVPTDNDPPVAQASDPNDADIELTPCESLDPIRLNGSRSYDPEFAELTYEWGVLEAPAGSSAGMDAFSDPYSARPLFQADVPGDYVFELRVHDGQLWSAWDLVTYTVQDASLNNAPVANAGDDIVYETEVACRETSTGSRCNPCPNIPFELDASMNTSDPDGDTLSYLWVQTDGDPIELSYPTGPVTLAYPGEEPIGLGDTITRTWTLQVRASDCALESTDTITLTYECTGTD